MSRVQNTHPKPYGRGKHSNHPNTVVHTSIQFDKLLSENANTPSASKSAGTIGKWGIASFTSIRSSTLTFNPRDSRGNTVAKNKLLKNDQLPTLAPPPPPSSTTQRRKFFKSGNTPAEVSKPVPPPPLPVQPVLPVQPPPPLPPPPAVPERRQPHYYGNIKKERILAATKQFYATSTVPPVVPQILPTASPINVNTVVSSSSSVNVDYHQKVQNENTLAADSTFTPFEKPTIEEYNDKKKVTPVSVKSDEEPLKICISSSGRSLRRSSLLSKPISYAEPDLELDWLEEEQEEAHRGVPESSKRIAEDKAFQNCGRVQDRSSARSPRTSKETVADHPPIVLRIFKGTAQLVTDDSSRSSCSPNLADQHDGFFSSSNFHHQSSRSTKSASSKKRKKKKHSKHKQFLAAIQEATDEPLFSDSGHEGEVHEHNNEEDARSEEEEEEEDEASVRLRSLRKRHAASAAVEPGFSVADEIAPKRVLRNTRNTSESGSKNGPNLSPGKLVITNLHSDHPTVYSISDGGSSGKGSRKEKHRRKRHHRRSSKNKEGSDESSGTARKKKRKNRHNGNIDVAEREEEGETVEEEEECRKKKRRKHVTEEETSEEYSNLQEDSSVDLPNVANVKKRNGKHRKTDAVELLRILEDDEEVGQGNSSSCVDDGESNEIDSGIGSQQCSLEKRREEVDSYTKEEEGSVKLEPKPFAFLPKLKLKITSIPNTDSKHRRGGKKRKTSFCVERITVIDAPPSMILEKEEKERAVLATNDAPSEEKPAPTESDKDDKDERSQQAEVKETECTDNLSFKGDMEPMEKQKDNGGSLVSGGDDVNEVEENNERKGTTKKGGCFFKSRKNAAAATTSLSSDSSSTLATAASITAVTAATVLSAGTTVAAVTTATGNGGVVNKKGLALYKHKWTDSVAASPACCDYEDTDVDIENGNSAGSSNDERKEQKVVVASGERMEEESTGEPLPLLKIKKQLFAGDTGVSVEHDGNPRYVTTIKCARKDKGFYTVVKNVKDAHQIQESGEFQEFNDDVEYILDALQDNNPISTRCLSAITLASKCTEPAFRMHVRAHGTVSKFFNALHDATKDQSLGMCTATVMFALSQDRLNMDLDRSSLELMLNLLESDASHSHALDDCGLTDAQLKKTREKVRQICADIQSQGHAVHLNLENITVGQLSMETLLSLTSKRAGEWFKEELRELGGLEHIVNTIVECCRHVDDTVNAWSPSSLDRIKKVNRCLRILQNVTTENEQNNIYLLDFENGILTDTLLRLYKVCDYEIPLYPTENMADKDSTGAILRECLIATLKVVINMTHDYNGISYGSLKIGNIAGVIDSSLHVLLQLPQYVPKEERFDLTILTLILLINLVENCVENRQLVLNAKAPSDDESIFESAKCREPAVKALIRMFHHHEELAKKEEKKTDAILDGEEKTVEKPSTHAPPKAHEEFIEETVAILLQKAGQHMEHTLIAAHCTLLLGHIIKDNEEYELLVRGYLPDQNFGIMISVLDKFFTFMTLTISGSAISNKGVNSTKMIIERLKESDKHRSGSRGIEISENYEQDTTVLSSEEASSVLDCST